MASKNAKCHEAALSPLGRKQISSADAKLLDLEGGALGPAPLTDARVYF